MKKALVLLLALTCIAGTAFAQLTVTGYVKTRLTLTEAGFAYYDRVRLNFAGTSEDKNIGLRVRMQTNTTLAIAAANATSAHNFALYDYAYGYAKFFDGMIKITAGKLQHFDYFLGQNLSNWQTGNVFNDLFNLYGTKGVLVQLYPVEGLDIGLKIIPTGALSADDFGVSASYAIGEAATIVLTSTLSDTIAESSISAGVSVSAVENLTAIVGYKGLSSTGIFAIFGYSADALYVEVASDIVLGDTLAYYVEGGVEYNMENMSIRGFGGYDNGIGNFSGAYFAGAELEIPVGKGIFNFGANYADVDGWAIPVFFQYAF